MTHTPLAQENAGIQRSRLVWEENFRGGFGTDRRCSYVLAVRLVTLPGST